MISHAGQATLISSYKEKCINETEAFFFWTKWNGSWTEHYNTKVCQLCSLHNNANQKNKSRLILLRLISNNTNVGRGPIINLTDSSPFKEI
jgi:hypothetical protein